jgi:hypothetical protein
MISPPPAISAIPSPALSLFHFFPVISYSPRYFAFITLFPSSVACHLSRLFPSPFDGQSLTFLAVFRIEWFERMN